MFNIFLDQVDIEHQLFKLQKNTVKSLALEMKNSV